MRSSSRPDWHRLTVQHAHDPPLSEPRLLIHFSGSLRGIRCNLASILTDQVFRKSITPTVCELGSDIKGTLRSARFVLITSMNLLLATEWKSTNPIYMQLYRSRFDIPDNLKQSEFFRVEKISAHTALFCSN